MQHLVPLLVFGTFEGKSTFSDFEVIVMHRKMEATTIGVKFLLLLMQFINHEFLGGQPALF